MPEDNPLHPMLDGLIHLVTAPGSQETPSLSILVRGRALGVLMIPRPGPGPFPRYALGAETPQTPEELVMRLLAFNPDLLLPEDRVAVGRYYAARVVANPLGPPLLMRCAQAVLEGTPLPPLDKWDLEGQMADFRQAGTFLSILLCFSCWCAGPEGVDPLRIPDRL